MKRLGVDVGGTFVKWVCWDGSRIVDRGAETRGGDLVEMVVGLVDRFEVSSVGIAMAGLVENGRFLWGPHTSDVDPRLPGVVAGRLGREVVVENDANAAAVAEVRHGAAVGVSDALVLSVGTGIGLGIIADGRLYRGSGLAGEAGHMYLGGETTCDCGRVGCWETSGSGRVLDQAASKLLGPGRHASDLLAAAAHGDESALLAVEEVGRRLARGVANLILVFDPAKVVVAGGVVEEPLLEAVGRGLITELGGLPYRRIPPVAAARFTRWAAAVGAAVLTEEDR